MAVEIIFLRAFAKLQKSTRSFVTFDRPSVRVGKLGSYWKDFN